MTDTNKKTDETPSIRPGEANALKSLVRSEFDLLGEELHQRYQEVVQQVRNRGHELREAAWERDVKPLADDVQHVIDELEGLVESTMKTLRRKGYKPSSRYDAELKVKNPLKGVMPSNLDVDEVLSDMHRQYLQVKNGLERQKQNFIRDLTLRSVTSEAAREFVLTLPTADELLTLPESATKILEG